MNEKEISVIQLDEIIAHFGGKALLARTLGVSLPAISKWSYRIPRGRAYQIEVLTKGHFKAEEIIEIKSKCDPTKKRQYSKP